MSRKEEILKSLRIGMFAALADETPDPYVTEVDAPYNKVEGEPPDGETATGDINEKLAVELSEKARRYIESPSDAPEGVEVEEGPQGGLYYETDEGESADDGREYVSEWNHARLFGMASKLNAKFGPGITHSFMRHTAEALSTVDPAMVNTVLAAINSDDEPEFDVGMKAEIEGEMLAEFLIQKARRYVDDPAEAPEGVDLEEGPQGGLYYETDSADGESYEEAESYDAEIVGEIGTDASLTLHEQGHDGYIVGGTVRDFFLGIESNDIDMTTDAPPERIMEVFEAEGYKTIPTGIDHGTITVIIDGEPVEITTYRVEDEYEDSRRPEEVEFVDDVEDDLARRDLTFNAMAYDPVTDEIVDPFGGQEDLEAGLIHTVGNPLDRFTEDGLRSLRAFRFAAKFGFDMEEDTNRALYADPVYDSLSEVSKERVQEETDKALVTDNPGRYFRGLLETDLIDHVLPELKNVEEDVRDHTIRAVELAEADHDVRLAALLQNIPEPTEAMKRLRYSNDTVDKVSTLIDSQDEAIEADMSDTELRRLVSHVGKDNFEGAVHLRQANLRASGEGEEGEAVESVINRYQQLEAEGVGVPDDLDIGGNNVIDAGVDPGPAVGQVMDHLQDWVLEDPDRNREQVLMEEAQRYIQEEGLDTGSKQLKEIEPGADTAAILEIKDYYRVWVKNAESVPDGHNIYYDGEGDPAGNHFYYEVPLETKTRIDLDKHGAEPHEITPVSSEKDTYPSRDELVSSGVPDKDIRFVDKVDIQTEEGAEVFNNTFHKTHPAVFRDVGSALTLLHVYKKLYDRGHDYAPYLNQIQKELGQRGIYAFEKISKARRYVESPSEAPEAAQVHEGERGGLYYETEDAAGEEGEESVSAVTEMVDNIPIEQWPEEHAVLSSDEIRDEVGVIFNRSDEAVAQNTLTHLKGFKDKTSGAAYRFQHHDIVLRPDTDTETLAHEIGHATLASYGYTVNDIGNMMAHFYPGHVPEHEFGEPIGDIAERLTEHILENPHVPDKTKEKTRENLEQVKETYEGMELHPGDMYVFVPDDWEGGEAPQDVQDLAEAVNDAWDRQIHAAKSDDMDAEEYVIGSGYSAANAHETMSMTHEMMQADHGDPHALENLYLRQQELLGAYVNLFEPADVQKDMLNELFKNFGPNRVWDELPYPDVEGLLSEQ